MSSIRSRQDAEKEGAFAGGPFLFVQTSEFFDVKNSKKVAIHKLPQLLFIF
jgi:hypothetical protein